jgi:RNA polymerase sigma-70 factor (ECF subfamily)
VSALCALRRQGAAWILLGGAPPAPNLLSRLLAVLVETTVADASPGAATKATGGASSATPRAATAPTAAARTATAEPPDEAAFAVLYGELARPLATYARRILGDAEEARDVVQEVFLRYLRAGMPAGHDPAVARPYLYRSTTHLLRDRWRRAARRRRWWQREGPPEDRVAPRDTALTRDVERAFRGLKPRDRALLWLAHVEGASHREIAAALDAGEASVRVMLFRARQRLGKALDEAGFPRPTEES